ncbi:TIGR03086 family metal-binding protein [Phytoactinopolyspora halotolerans]|uniref:TIGR03086 family protein n=1 Tax=Phytoactinopolyspora halotolerans TaxID=1981512 RepID=A0A6L9S763_9ACTN|nr:TIGR03086 family metal-binding protein [Phytoactinopolyspora halotolerans]NEE00398.1 TIGR03086 family protein [Phytoactinopolyspora halotolerans]
MLDIEPATRVLAGLVRGVGHDRLSAPTPCPEMSLGDLLHHVDGLSVAFTMAATKSFPDGGSQAPSADAAKLGPDWRQRIPEQLAELAQAWKDEAAWTGMTEAGGVQLPAEIAGLVALDEVVIHGWDIAVASGQGFSCDPELLQAVHGFVEASAAENPEGTPGLFGPPVPVPADAPLLDRVIGLTGRDPSWRPPSMSDAS